MNRLKNILYFLSFLSLSFFACNKESYSEQLTAEWNSTAIKIDGVAAPSSTTMFMHLQTGDNFEITTGITPFTHPTSGKWSASKDNSEITLAGNVWTIHHLEGNTLRIGNTVDGKELEIDFSK
jgi:hypothetical protein